MKKKTEVTENVCGNPAFYVQGDKSFNRQKIGKYYNDEMRENCLSKIQVEIYRSQCYACSSIFRRNIYIEIIAWLLKSKHKLANEINCTHTLSKKNYPKSMNQFCIFRINIHQFLFFSFFIGPTATRTN